METTREEFLSNVRRRLRATRPAPRREQKPAPAPSPSRAQIIATFTAALERIGGHAYPNATAEEARGQLARILRECGIRRVVWADAPAVRELKLELLGNQFEFVRAPVDDRSLAQFVRASDAALTGAQYAIAATGSLVMASGPDQPRVLSALSATHIAVVKTGQLVASFDDVTPFIRETVRKVSNITLVTGPSRTGDIEQTITIGAHGPRQVHVILLD